jgi:predicted ArsR family transcriptional regulator
MATKKRGNTPRKQKMVTAKQASGGINLCEVAESIALAKKEVRELLEELEREERESGGSAVGSKGREKLEAGLRELNDLMQAIPPIHNYC